MINDNEIFPIWDNFKRELHEDNKSFFQCFNNSKLHCNHGVRTNSFVLYEHEYYIYCCQKYQRSSDSKWQFWREIFLVQTDVNMTACDLYFEPCTLNHNCSVTLSPYFWDNRTIEGYIQKISGVPEARELKDMLDMAKQNKEKHGMFAYKEEFDEEGGSWDENVWSKRLTACLGKFIVSNPAYTVEYTGDKGNHIYRN